MKRYLKSHTPVRQLLFCVLAASFVLPLPASAASVALATSPLATSTTSTVKPNIMFVLDDSGSMSWDHMPDDTLDAGSDVTFSFGYYGVRSSQCNQVYYNPAITYQPPIRPDGTSYPNASFTGAWTNGFSTSSGAVNLNTSFQANQTNLSGTLGGGADTAGPAYYYSYSGTQSTSLQRNYNSTSNTFYNECHSANGATPGSSVFTRINLAARTATITVGSSGSTSVSGITVNGAQIMADDSGTATTSTSTLASNIATQINACTNGLSGDCTASGYVAVASGSIVTIFAPAAASTYTPVVSKSGTMTFTATAFPTVVTDATHITDPATLRNFANWYSYYRTRLLMMKTATGHAFSSLDKNYRVGLMKISLSSTPTVYLNIFWDNTDTSLGPVSTHRTSWYNALYNTTAGGSTPLRTALSDAGRYYAGKLSGTDPLQYSCQQNFTILSTDGYWNSGDGFQVDGSAAIGNQDGTAGRPMFDGTQANTTVTTTYTRNSYSSSSSGCSSGRRRLRNQPQIQSCSVTTVAGVAGSENCTAWSNNGSSVYVAPYTSSTSTCASSVTLPSPNPSSRVVSGTPVTTPGSTGATSDNLADIAMYYYQTDLRTPDLNNCTGAVVPPATTGSIICSTPATPTDPDPYNNVFIGGSDNNVQQHMTTFTLGLGASGKMNYSSSYLGDTSGDYVSVKLGSTASSTASPPVCSWQADGTVCNWPVPGMAGTNGLIANIDDLWHAAVNGRGAYFSATDPASLSAGLSNALAGINTRKGSAAAAATSTLNPVAGDNFAYVASYTTITWKGNLEARGINVDTGVVSENATWCVENVVAGTCASPGAIVAETSGSTTVYNCVTPNSVICTGGELVGTDCKIPVATACTGTMSAKVADASDTRTIKTANSAGAALTNFDAAYAAANPANFAAAHIGSLSQWSSLTATQKTAAAGANLVNFLRGQHGYEDRSANAAANRLYRYREAVLGDALESQPAFIGKPVFSYPYTGYSAYVTAQASRAGTVYMGANDGMMHAFAADTGIERWAYVPSMVIADMWKLADMDYATLHTNLVNGSPITSDIYCPGNCGGAVDATFGDSASWRTILVAGLNGGGRGYYALDITVPDTPTLLWEFTTTAGIGITKDDDAGYSFGQPIITRKADGTWVVLVTSGYNNTSPGDGKGYLYVLNANTGAAISKFPTGVGSTTTPSGLARIVAWNDEPAGNQAGYVYGGDLLGNVWRFNINAAAATGVNPLKLATLYSDGTTPNTAGTLPQPITTTPVLGKILGKRVIYVGTGKYLETGDLTTTQKQTQYAIKDDDATSTLVNPRTTLVQQTLTNNPDGTATRLVSSNAVDFSSGRGWYVDFPDSGERANIDSKLVQGVLLVATVVPSNTVCSPGGYGWLSFFNYKTGGAVDSASPGLVSLKSDATIVGVNVIYVQGVPKISWVTSNDPTPKQPPGQPNIPISAAGFTGKRVIWRELIQ